MPVLIPKRVSTLIGRVDGGLAWLARLPDIVERLAARWDLRLGPPLEAEASYSWVAHCVRGEERLVLKIGWPHDEARDEIDGLLYWSGGPVVELREFDRDDNALLLERCEPGTPLRGEPEEAQDEVIAELLQRLWARRPTTPASTPPFRPLADMIRTWSAESRSASEDWPDPKLAERGLAAYQALCTESRDDTPLATDLHAGNVLRSRHERWLVIDPKPYVGDRCYDATQHLLNCLGRLRADPKETVVRFAGLLDVDPERVGAWLFARLATESGDRAGKQALARGLEDLGFGRAS